MDYVAIVVTFVAALLAIRGNTWENGKPTAIGWLTVAVAVVGLATAVTITKETRENNENLRNDVTKANESLEGAVQERMELKQELQGANESLALAVQERTELREKLQRADHLLQDATKERTRLSEILQDTEGSLKVAEQQRENLSQKLNQTSNELQESRKELEYLRAHQEKKEKEKAEFESKYAFARGLIQFLVTGTCSEDWQGRKCLGLHMTQAGTAHSRMVEEKMSAFDAILEELGDHSGWEPYKSKITAYGPERTNEYAGDLLQ